MAGADRPRLRRCASHRKDDRELPRIHPPRRAGGRARGRRARGRARARRRVAVHVQPQPQAGVAAPGDDTLHTADGHPELVSGGPDVDHAVRDGGDLLISVETSAFGPIPAGRGATRPGSVSTAVAARFAS